MFKPPRVIGHEFTGVVSALGKGVTKFKVGDRVAVETGLACDSCYFCRDGREHQCLHRYAHPGGYAEYSLYPDRNVHKLPDSLSFEFAALAEPVACALHAIDLAKVRSGDVALVLAGGTIGCIMTQLLLHSGASKVLISEPRAHRREICKAVGGIPVDPKGQDLAAFVKDQTGRPGAGDRLRLPRAPRPPGAGHRSGAEGRDRLRHGRGRSGGRRQGQALPALRQGDPDQGRLPAPVLPSTGRSAGCPSSPCSRCWAWSIRWPRPRRPSTPSAKARASRSW